MPAMQQLPQDVLDYFNNYSGSDNAKNFYGTYLNSENGNYISPSEYGQYQNSPSYNGYFGYLNNTGDVTGIGSFEPGDNNTSYRYSPTGQYQGTDVGSGLSLGDIFDVAGPFLGAYGLVNAFGGSGFGDIFNNLGQNISEFFSGNATDATVNALGSSDIASSALPAFGQEAADDAPAISGGGGFAPGTLGSGSYALDASIPSLGLSNAPTTGSTLGAFGDFVGPPAAMGGGTAGSSILGNAVSGLSSLFGNTNLSTLARLGGGLYDLYARNQQADALMDRYNQINEQANNYYAPGSPEANLMRQTIERQDARAGRNSQYGTREVELAARLAQLRANNTNALAPQQNALLQAALRNQYGAPASLFSLLGRSAAPALGRQVPEMTLSDLFNKFLG